MIHYTIYHPLINLEIKLEEIHRLAIHEEVLPVHLENLVKSIRAKQHLMHPIIVDRQNLVVLDGMHRIAAIQKLGYQFIPVCLLDYLNPHVFIGGWYRVIHASSRSESVIKYLLSQRYTLKENNLNMAQNIVEQRKAIAALIFRSKCYTIHGIHDNIHDIYQEIKKIEYNLRKSRFLITYQTETDALTRSTSAEDTSILMVPTVKKEEVINAALKNRLFNHKTTRHVIPLRPMFINIPINWLHNTNTLKDMNQTLVEYLSKKSFQHLPPGQVLDRRYDEELYLFVEEKEQKCHES